RLRMLGDRLPDFALQSCPFPFKGRPAALWHEVLFIQLPYAIKLIDNEFHLRFISSALAVEALHLLAQLIATRGQNRNLTLDHGVSLCKLAGLVIHGLGGDRITADRG